MGEKLNLKHFSSQLLGIFLDCSIVKLSGCRLSCCSEEEEQLRHVTGQVGRHVTKNNLRSGLLTGDLYRDRYCYKT